MQVKFESKLACIFLAKLIENKGSILENSSKKDKT